MALLIDHETNVSNCINSNKMLKMLNGRLTLNLRHVVHANLLQPSI